ncbi:MAG: hypothetical protein HZC24_00800 [Rhodocyclales bacterium]|nr:hypothetical protein [Rhodocyclales bacterium]
MFATWISVSAAEIDVARDALRQGESASAFLRLQRIIAANPDNHEAKDLLVRADAESSPLASRGERFGWLGVEWGYDSNITSATSASAVDVPFLSRSVPLKKPLFAVASDFLGINGGAAVNRSLNGSIEGFLFGQASARYNRREAQFFPHSYPFAAGLTGETLPFRWSIAANALERWVGAYQLLSGTGLGAQAAYVDDRAVGTATLEWRRSNYPYFDHVRTTGLHYGMGLQDRIKRTGLSVFSGSERAQGTEKSLDRQVAGIEGKAAYDWIYGSEVRLFAACSQSDYFEPSPMFLVRRRDTMLAMTAEADFTFADRWHALPRLRAERNRSNIPLLDFKRWQVSLELRREF